MFYSNVPFVTHQSPVGEETHPNTMTLGQWMSSPVDFQGAVVWNEDMQPQQDFMFGPNAKSTRYKMYNRGIIPRFAGPMLMDIVPASTVQQQVARGIYPSIPGVDLRAQADSETFRSFVDTSYIQQVNRERRAQMQELDQR